MNTKNMPFQMALDAIHKAKHRFSGLDPTLHLAEITPCSVEDLQRLQYGVRAALAQLREMGSLYTGDADLKVRVSDIKDNENQKGALWFVIIVFPCWRSYHVHLK